VTPSLVIRLRASAAAAAAGLVAIGGSALAVASPMIALGALGCALLTLVAVRMPVAHLVVLVGVAVMLPPEILNQTSVGGGVGAPGLTPTDVLILTGCLRVAFTLGHEPLDARRFWVGVSLMAFLALAALQLWHGLGGYWMPQVVAEFRVLLGIAAMFLALPIVARDDQLRRLWTGLVVIGLALGIWGILQWVLHLQFADAKAVLQGARFATAGRVAGLYGFPVAIVLASAALLSGHVRAWRTRLVLGLVVAVNTTALILTFQRSFWIAIAAGFIYLLLRTGWRQRITVVLGVPALLGLVLLAVSVVAPAELAATKERVFSLSDYRTDPSFTYRKAESRMVEQRIRAHPLTGSGLGASQLIGRPGTRAPVKRRAYVESGYLWLAWKIGVPGAALLCGVLLYAAVCRQSRPDTLARSLRIGSQASLVTLAVSNVAFAPFNSIAGTTMIGVLIALAIGPVSTQIRPGCHVT
jgi:O-Antigen ligase